MWAVMLQINSALLALSAVFVIYALGHAILAWAWKEFALALLLFVFLVFAQIALAALSEP